MKTNRWELGEKHKKYGVVVLMAVKEGEPERVFKNKDGSFARIPLSVLQLEQDKEYIKQKEKKNEQTRTRN